MYFPEDDLSRTGTYQAVAVGQQGYSLSRPGDLQCQQEFSGASIPDASGAVRRRTDEPLAIGVKGDCPDDGIVPLQRAPGSPPLEVQEDESLTTAHGERVAVGAVRQRVDLSLAGCDGGEFCPRLDIQSVDCAAHAAGQLPAVGPEHEADGETLSDRKRANQLPRPRIPEADLAAGVQLPARSHQQLSGRMKRNPAEIR